MEKTVSYLREVEKARVNKCAEQFLNGKGAILALQKDAYNAISQNQYDLNLAVKGELRSSYKGIPIYGTPPTRWLYTAKMKTLLLKIKEDLLR